MTDEERYVARAAVQRAVAIEVGVRVRRIVRYGREGFALQRRWFGFLWLTYSEYDTGEGEDEAFAIQAAIRYSQAILTARSRHEVWP